MSIERHREAVTITPIYNIQHFKAILTLFYIFSPFCFFRFNLKTMIFLLPQSPQNANISPMAGTLTQTGKIYQFSPNSYVNSNSLSLSLSLL